ncbi:heparan-alpha-glucosaminide N-acetyltransferase domain-containing protein [Nocardioides sp. SR21]|uniref:heparan-alpha-glucosaminide N-acetyltransferase domain-containing protein n=1 Tax=Nocardioides sp. SR21 TaxID=2919501 RepID=UPI001FAA3B56|nr:heparan-alpha-glucosaminide N-acetyltransferase domain-containing protein [Nocardioides sp. SR21]
MAARAGGRLIGLDIARCLALLGMVATHMLDERTPSGDLSFGQWLAGGRASALFAVLAGVSLALMTREPLRGRAAGLRAVAIGVRALLIAALGLALGGLESGLAIILTYYGVLFVLGLPFTFLGARALALLAVVWVVVAPVLSHLVRPALPERGYASPTFGQLADPWQLASELLFTGYYPVVPWLAYLFAGLALGRADLRDRSLLVGLTVGGLGVAILATQVSRSLVDPAVADANALGMYGTTPPDGDWSWLLLVAPHSATPFDLAQTIGSAIFVIGFCLLAVQALSPTATAPLAILFGAGAMTLTLYSLHVVLRTPSFWPPEIPHAYLKHVVVLLAIGAAFAAFRLRGPLEIAVGLPARLVRRVRVPGPA